MNPNDERRPVRAPHGPAEDIYSVPDHAAFLYAFDCGENVGELRGETRGYRDGFADGDAHGHARAMEEVEAAESAWRDQIVRSASRLVTSRTPFAELSERRGEPERAERQRRLLAERGVTQ